MISPVATFRLGMRITVATPDKEHRALMGKTGAVVRLRSADNAAWVRMDERTEEYHDWLFPADDSSGRGSHVMLWPDECTEVKP